MEVALLVLVVAVALVFGFTNGFQDTSNAIATSVTTRALTPRTAIVLASVMNFVGALLGTGVAETIATGIVSIDPSSAGGPSRALLVILAGLLGAIAWNVITWWRGYPSSSTQALVGGLVGAGAAGSLIVPWEDIGRDVAIPMVLSPLLGFALAYLAMAGLLWVLRGRPRGRTNRGFGLAQTVSAAAVALGHGLQDAQKTMGVILLALFATGALDRDAGVPLWVKLSAAAALSLGTYAGGWRIVRTLGRRLIRLDPAQGFVAETVSAGVLYIMAIGLHAPISTTQTITCAIVGAGSTRRFSAVRWGVAGRIGLTWLVTLPAAAAIAALALAVLTGLTALVG